MADLFRWHRNGFWTRERRHSLYLGLTFLAASVAIQIGLGRYSARRALSAAGAGDLFLDHLPVLNLGSLIVPFFLGVWVFAWLLFIYRPRYLLFATKVIALYIICRAFFLSLTHLGPYQDQLMPGPNNFGFGFYKMFTFEGNYFFSGHTGFPFLLALIFWENRFLRRLFIALTVLFGATVLLAHVHYSIDVFAAPFIVYGIYVIASKAFPEDFALTTSGG